MSVTLKRILVILGIFVLVGLIGFGVYFYGNTIAVRLVVLEYPEQIYLGEAIDDNDVVAVLETFFGTRSEPVPVTVSPRSDFIIVESGRFKVNCTVKILEPESFNVVYDGTVYAGKSLNPDLCHVFAVYSDGVSREVEILDIPKDIIPFATECTLVIQTSVGEATWVTDVSAPVSIEGYYDDDVTLGDAFDKSKVSVLLYYADGTSLEVTDFEVENPPEFLSEDTVVRISSFYGVTDLELKPSNQQKLKAEYDGEVRIGDCLDPNKVVLTMLTEDGTRERIDDFEIDPIGYVRADVRTMVRSRYGDAEISVKSVPVSECTADISGELVEGRPITVSALHLRYEDGSVVDLSPDEVEFKNFGMAYHSGDFDAWFDYHGVAYSFPVMVIPSEIVNLRDSDPNVNGEVCTTYGLTDSQVKTIAMLCQRAAGNNIALVAAEASLLANRYELYGDGNGNSDGAYIVKFMKECGYWGEDVNGYIRENEADQTACFVVRDVLINGHRIFPRYVDERVDRVGVSMTSTPGMFIQNETEVFKHDGTIFWFYSFVSTEQNLMYGYTDRAYTTITGFSVPSNHMSFTTGDDTDSLLSDDIVIDY